MPCVYRFLVEGQVSLAGEGIAYAFFLLRCRRIVHIFTVALPERFSISQPQKFFCFLRLRELKSFKYVRESRTKRRSNTVGKTFEREAEGGLRRSMFRSCHVFFNLVAQELVRHCRFERVGDHCWLDGLFPVLVVGFSLGEMGLLVHIAQRVGGFPFGFAFFAMRGKHLHGSAAMKEMRHQI